MNRTHKIILNIFKLLMIAVILFNLVLRGASGHQFELPVEELLGYIAMLLSIILISIHPFIHGVLYEPMKYVTIFFLIGVLLFALFLSKSTFSIDYENWFTAVFFYLSDAAFIGLSAYSIFLVFTDRVMKKESN